MTLKSLCSKGVFAKLWRLMKEDMKRRVWVIALLLLIFFFAMPVNLALTLENAQRTGYSAYSLLDFMQKKGLTPEQYQEFVKICKTEAVLDQISYGNGAMVTLFLAAAVIVGVTGFSYLHNRKKVDFYHSIPVRREMIFAARYLNGLLIPAAAYLTGCLLFVAAAAAYGVSPDGFIGQMAVGFGMNLLYYSLLYGTVTAAMMMTGNVAVGLLGTTVFFAFFPLAAWILANYASTFFVTAPDDVWNISQSPYTWMLRRLSPLGAYIWSAAVAGENRGGYLKEAVKTAFAWLALTGVSLELYRLRPLEAAGRAMAFKRTMAPIRVLMVLLGGLGGGLFFWALQSQVKWGIFGIAVGIVLTHCITEIIYHLDFKKLFSHRLQLAFCLAAGVLVFCGYRYDWYGYDSYMPKAEEIEYSSLEISNDSRFLVSEPMVEEKEEGKEIKYRTPREFVREHMKLTDSEAVLAIAQAGCDYVKESREMNLARWEEELDPGEAGLSAVSDVYPDGTAVSVIGGADGPASVFVAAKEGADHMNIYGSQVTVSYTLKNGRTVRRQYWVNLKDTSEAYKAYETVYDQEAYKRGLYPILTETPEQIGYASCQAGAIDSLRTTERDEIERLLTAYQQDLMAQTIKERRKEDPVASLQLVRKDVCRYMAEHQGELANRASACYEEKVRIALGLDREGVMGAIPPAEKMGDYLTDAAIHWPVYPSFTNTLKVLETLGQRPETYFVPENTVSISIDVSSAFMDEYGVSEELPQGETLSALQRENPHYQETGSLLFDAPKDIETLMPALRNRDLADMNGLCKPEKELRYTMPVSVLMKDGSDIAATLWPDAITPEIEALFAGIAEAAGRPAQQ